MPPAKQPAKDGPRPGYERVRLTIRPGEEIDVPADEAAVLRHQGLIAEDKPAVEAATPADTPKE
jgi:hypothetical protein